jgi:signal transduction histidine kinase
VQPKDSAVVQGISEYLQCLMSRGAERAACRIPDLNQDCESDEIRELNRVFAEFIKTLQDSYEFQKNLANGELDAQVDRKNTLAMPLRALQSSLKHLIWQVSRVADGDLNQQVFFLGDFSDSFNRMIASLKEREALENKLQDARKLEALGLMAGGVAHDLNNILAGIVTYPELLLMNLPEDSDLREPIKVIQESGERAATVVADLLTIAQNAASIREQHDINVLIREYHSSPEGRKLAVQYPDITVEQQLTAEHAAILCSPVHVKRCLMNLVTNAAEAVENSGVVKVATCNKQIDESAARALKIRAGEYVVVSVRDSGSGIARQDLEHIFEPFYTKKVMGRSGTGLGLTIIWNTMESHGGRVLVESSSAGTCFQLFFPTCEQKEKAASQGTVERCAANREHVLIVDDDPQIRDIACQILQIFDYHVDSVCSGELALKFIKDNSVDLVILDMLMEPGMNGRQTYEKILEIRPDQKAIIASGFSDSDEVKAALQLGAAGFIKKPYSIDQLGRAVKNALG